MSAGSTASAPSAELLRIPSSVATTRWGTLPIAGDPPIASVEPGEAVLVDALSHEGIQTDQGGDPIAFFGAHGITPDRVLDDMVDIARSGPPAGGDVGPHIITGPIEVRGAERGDLLAIDVLALDPRVDYGIVSNRHGHGALPGELPEGDARVVSTFCTADWERGLGALVVGSRTIRFPLRPFLGIMGVALETAERPSSVPPGRHGGNLDVRVLGVGSTLYLPVQAPGALAYVGDPHFSQGDGEVALTAFEASLTATIRFRLLKRGTAECETLRPVAPLGETAEHWHPIGLDPTLAEAMRDGVRRALALLEGVYGVPRAAGLAYLSAASDFTIGQVVDQVQDVYGTIRKSDFDDWRM